MSFLFCLILTITVTCSLFFFNCNARKYGEKFEEETTDVKIVFFRFLLLTKHKSISTAVLFCNNCGGFSKKIRIRFSFVFQSVNIVDWISSGWSSFFRFLKVVHTSRGARALTKKVSQALQATVFCNEKETHLSSFHFRKKQAGNFVSDYERELKRLKSLQ